MYNLSCWCDDYHICLVGLENIKLAASSSARVKTAAEPTETFSADYTLLQSLVFVIFRIAILNLKRLFTCQHVYIPCLTGDFLIQNLLRNYLIFDFFVSGTHHRPEN